MCRSAAELLSRFAGVLLLACLLAPACLAQPAPTLPEHHFELNPSTRALLSRLQGQWLEWLTAISRGEQERAESAIDRLEAYAGQLNMERLPELSAAAAVLAVQEAKEGRPTRAEWGLQAAERLDPGRPETSFAAYAVHRASGGRLSGLPDLFRGWKRTLSQRSTRAVVAHTAGIWLVSAVLLAALLFIAVEIVVRGGQVYRDAAAWLGRKVPAPWPGLGAGLFLLWPLIVADGWLWFGLFGSLLIWMYATWAERGGLVLAWLGLALAPTAIADQQHRVQIAVHPQILAIEAAAENRLEGGVLNDLAVLHDRLPESSAVLHATADLHRRFGQCDLAEAYYARVLDADVDHPAALADLGVCAFDLGGFERAIGLFRRAAESGPPRAEVHFNLSQALAELYRFREAEVELRRARAIDAAKVNAWIRERDPRAVVPVDGGLARSDEIRRQLLAQWGDRQGLEARMRGLTQSSTVPTAVVCLFLALAYRSVVKIRSRGAEPEGGRWFRGPAETWRSALLPGVPEGEESSWVEALLALLVFAALLTLARLGTLGIPMPWRYTEAPQFGFWIATAGLVVFFVARWREQNGGYFW